MTLDQALSVSVAVAVRNEARALPALLASLRAQASREARLMLADDVIVNEGRIDDLAEQVERLHERYLQLAETA